MVEGAVCIDNGHIKHHAELVSERHHTSKSAIDIIHPSKNSGGEGSIIIKQKRDTEKCPFNFLKNY